MCADIFDIMLAFVYTNEVPRLGQRHLSSASILQLFDAADLHLLLAMKVPYCIFRQNSWHPSTAMHIACFIHSCTRTKDLNKSSCHCAVEIRHALHFRFASRLFSNCSLKPQGPS